MIRVSFCAAIAWLLATTLAHATDPVGFRQTELDKQGPRPLLLSVWYPTATHGKADPVGGNGAFFGIEAIRDAEPGRKSRPLVLLSHGYGGSWRNLNWLAGDLVQHGYIVAAPDHPGTTVFDRDPAQAARLWERPRDLSRSIDALLADPGLAGPIDAGRIAAIGHSLGGWTVAAMAGARFDAGRFAKDCEHNTSPRACSLADELGLKRPELGQEMGDPRVGAFVSLDLGLARGFSPESLEGIAKPFLVVAAGIDVGGLPSRLESGYLADHLPKASATFVEIPDAMHFSFMSLCKPGAAARIEADSPGDGVVCKDGGTRGRETIHRDIRDLIIGFLAKALPAP